MRAARPSRPGACNGGSWTVIVGSIDEQYADTGTGATELADVDGQEEVIVEPIQYAVFILTAAFLLPATSCLHLH